MSPVHTALSVVCSDLGAGDPQGFLDIALLAIAALLASLPPDLTVSELAEHLQQEHP